MTCIGKILRTVLLVVSAVVAVGCGGTPMGDIVRYEGEILVVYGVSYPRRPEAEVCSLGLVGGKAIYETGVVYIWVPYLPEEYDQLAQLKSRLDDLGLVSREPLDGSLGAVLVPVGWEDQWARALRAEPKVRYVDLNCAFENNA